MLIVNGQPITFSGEVFNDFQAEDGPSTFNFTQGPDGVEITLIPDEQVIYRVNAGATVAAIDGGPDWIGDNGLGAAPVGGVTMTGNKTATFMNAITDAENEVDFDNVDGAIVPWQVFVDERGKGGTEYTFAVQAGLSYKIEYFYTENWQNIYTSAVRACSTCRWRGSFRPPSRTSTPCARPPISSTARAHRCPPAARMPKPITASPARPSTSTPPKTTR